MNNILPKVCEKHNWIVEHKDKYHIDSVVMTVLIGSQNYDLDTKDSDVDTCSFVFPCFDDFIQGTKFINVEHTFSDNSKIVIKDLRLAFNLLRKPSPNSVETFVSHYKVFNPQFEKVLDFYLQDDYTLYYLTHANYKNMVNAIAGCAQGIHGRNMTIGKQYAHILRLHDMLLHYLDRIYQPFEYITLEPQNLHIALAAKLGFLPVTEQSCKNLSNTLAVFAHNFKPTISELARQVVSNQLINDFQRDLTEVYLDARHH